MFTFPHGDTWGDSNLNKQVVISPAVGVYRQTELVMAFCLVSVVNLEKSRCWLHRANQHKKISLKPARHMHS